MKTKLYIVSGRQETEILTPKIFKTKTEAEIFVSNILYKIASNCYEDEEYFLGEDKEYDRDILDKWANDKGYMYENDEYGGLFYNGNEYIELVITECEIEI